MINFLVWGNHYFDMMIAELKVSPPPENLQLDVTDEGITDSAIDQGMILLLIVLLM